MLLLIALVAFMFSQRGQSRPVFYESKGAGVLSTLANLDISSPPKGESIYWVADLAEQTMPFVVNIQTKIKASAKESDTANNNSVGPQLAPSDELMEQMRQLLPFGQNFDRRQFRGQQEDMVAGEGSGFIIREDGYVVTNSHVVNRANLFTIRMHDGKEYDAELVGTDNYKDIAVLKIKGGGKFPVALLGDSSSTRIGEPVIAIGSPLGLKASVTAGIISTNDRSLSDLGRPQDVRRPQKYLQTDAAINRGNSGGPLLNARGEVIGVNQAIARWDNSPNVNNELGMVPIEGIGFAIPINEVKATIEQIVQNGKVVYPGISAEITTLKNFIEDNKRRGIDLGLSVKEGVYVSRVTLGGPAARAGIEANDVILGLNGVDVTSADQLILEINKYKVGDRITLRIARQGGEKLEDVAVVLGELDLSAISPGD
jgi:serine protease Do